MKYKSHYLQAIIGVILLYQKLRRLPRHLTGYLMLLNEYSKRAKNNCAFDVKVQFVEQLILVEKSKSVAHYTFK